MLELVVFLVDRSNAFFLRRLKIQYKYNSTIDIELFTLQRYVSRNFLTLGNLKIFVSPMFSLQNFLVPLKVLSDA